MDDILNNNEEMTVEVVTFQDDEGNEFDMEIVEEFEHAGRRFALLCEAGAGCNEEHDHEECDCGCCGGEEEALYIFEVVTGDDGEEFVAIEDDALLEELSAVAENILFAEDEE